MILLISTLFILAFQINSALSGIVYTDPKPGAEFVSIHNTIVIGISSGLTSLNDTRINVTGSQSGTIKGSIISTAGKLIFKPDSPYEFNEIITVKGYIENNSFLFNFHTQSSYVEWTIENTLRSELGEKYPIPF